jgi:predicted transcriptional regulator
MRTNQKTGDLSNLERGQIVGAHLAGASVTKTATLLEGSTAAVSKVMSAYTDHVKTTSAKRDSDKNEHRQQEIAVH